MHYVNETSLYHFTAPLVISRTIINGYTQWTDDDTTFGSKALNIINVCNVWAFCDN